MSEFGRLISARISGPCAFFFVSGEGKFFPNGVEQSSGFVLDQRERVWYFWTEWDTARDDVILAEWEMVTPEPAWREAEEYRQARQELGLPL